MQVRKTVFWILVVLAILGVAIRFGYQPITRALGLVPLAGIHVESDVPSKVFLNGQQVGATTYESKTLSAGNYLVEVKPDISQASVSAMIASSSATPDWKREIHLNAGTLTVVHREFINSPSTSSGEVITLEQGKGVTIVTDPADAEVSVNGQTRGSSPFHLTDLTSGEYQFIISKDNYLKRSIRATLVDGFNLTLSVDLAPNSSNSPTSPTPSPSSTSTSAPSATPTASSSPAAAGTFKVVVTGTPNGFLRVRATPSTSATEVTRVNDGTILTVLDQSNGWYHVQLSDGTKGYVSSVYTKKQ